MQTRPEANHVEPPDGVASEAVVAGYQPRPELTKCVTLPARPEPITLKPSETAVDR